MAESTPARLPALGDELRAAHDELRADLRALREQAGHGPGFSTTLRLRPHCLAFCAALTRHHEGEDHEMFPALVAADPALAPVVAQLREDHVLVAGLLRQVEDAVAGLPSSPTGSELERFRSSLDGIAAILESHFGFEERRVAAELDRWRSPVRPPGWSVRPGHHDVDHD